VRLGPLCADLSHGPFAAPLRHLHIDERDVGPVLARERNCLVRVGGGADQLEAVGALDQVAERMAERVFVLADKNASHRAIDCRG
jgi:hypothetical protein